MNTTLPSVEELDLLRSMMRRLAVIPDEQWQAFCALPRAYTLPKGERLIRQGDRDIISGFVLEGVVRSFYLSPSGEEFIRNFAAEGGFVSAYGSAIRHEPSNLTVEALENTRLLVLPYRELEAFYPRHMCWQEFGRKLAEHYYSLREQHAFQLMSMKGRERYAAFRHDFPYLVGRVPQKQVAAFLGLTATSLNRLIAAERRKPPRVR